MADRRHKYVSRILKVFSFPMTRGPNVANEPCVVAVQRRGGSICLLARILVSSSPQDRATLVSGIHDDDALLRQQSSSSRTTVGQILSHGLPGRHGVDCIDGLDENVD